MKRSALLVSAVLTFAIGATPIWAADPPAPTLNQLMKERMDAGLAQGKIREEQDAALAPQNAKVNGYWQLLNALQGPAKTDAQITEMKTQLEQAKAQVASLEKSLELVQITDPDKRAAKLKELQAERDKLAQDLYGLQAPYQKRIQDVVAPLAKTAPAYTDGLSKFLKDGAGLKADKLRADTSDYIQILWKDADGKMAVTGSLNIEDPKGMYPFPNKVDGKYPIEMNTNTIMNLRVGYFRLSINAQKADLQGDTAKLTALIKSLVDLDGLAAAKPE